MSAQVTRPYSLAPLTPHFGAKVTGFDLTAYGPNNPLPKQIVETLKDDIKKHRLMVFKGHCLSGEQQVLISQQLGQIESTFYKHPKSPHPDVFRVSNDPKEGCVGVGRTGWHIDGTFQPCPFKYQTMHFHSVCEGGDTWFVPLKEFYEMQDEHTKQRWDSLYMITDRRQQGVAHPLVYQHPVRGDVSMIFHCGPPFCDGWAVVDSEGKVEKVIPSTVIQEELTSKLDEAVDKIGVKMTWEKGDFAINDNVGNAHYASPGTQSEKGVAGLRILHRTTIAGETVPTKQNGATSFILK